MRVVLLTVFLFSFVTATAQPLDTLNKKRLALVIGTELSIYTGGMLYLSEIWYRDQQRVPLHFYNDNAGWNQMDKFAHAFVAYRQSRAGYDLLRWSGVSKNKALWFGGTLGFFFQLPIEIFDGLYEGYGFSWGDVWANTAGSVLFMTQEWLFDEQPIKFKYSFFPSPYAPYRPRALGQNIVENMVMDYNAQTYWFSLNVNRIIPSDRIPTWLSLAVGYSAGGMLGEFTNPTRVGGQPIPEFTRYRQFLLSPDIDLIRIPTNRKWLKGLLYSFNIVKVPAPTLEFNTEKGWIFHFIYF
jgi:uncharacterized protein YfiM (DUF2279 family)